MAVVVMISLMPMLALPSLGGFEPVLLLPLLFLGFLMLEMLAPLWVVVPDPVGATFFPPFARMPVVFFVEIAVTSPIGNTLEPLGVGTVSPVGVMLMPPVSLVPLVVGAVIAPEAVIMELAVDLRMVLHETLQLRVVAPVILVENQVGVSA